MRVVLGAGDDARLVVGGQPHRLGFVELRILKRREAQQPIPQARMQTVLGDVDLVAEDQLQGLRAVRRRLAAPCGAAREALSTAPLRRRPVAAAARRGCDRAVRPPGRSLRPVAAYLAHALRGTPIGRPMARARHRGRRCCPARGVASAGAMRSGCRIRLAASCPGSERAGRTSPGRCRAGAPWPRSEDASRAGAPAQPERRPRRRARRVRLARTETVRVRRARPADGTCRGRPQHPRPSWPCRSRGQGRSRSRPEAVGRRPRRRAGRRHPGRTGASG